MRFVFWNEGSGTADRGFVDCVSWSGAAAGSGETETTPVPVPHTWLVANGRAAAGTSAASFEAAALAPAKNGRPVWECYVAGLDPQKNDDFRLSIDLAGGEPILSWWPSNVAGRSYAVWGKASLADEWSSPVNPAHHFFQVRVALDDAGTDAFKGPVAVTFDPAGEMRNRFTFAEGAASVNFGEEVVRIQDISFKTDKKSDGKKSAGGEKSAEGEAAGESGSGESSSSESGSGESSSSSSGESGGESSSNSSGFGDNI